MCNVFWTAADRIEEFNSSKISTAQEWHCCIPEDFLPSWCAILYSEKRKRSFKYDKIAKIREKQREETEENK